ncbi:MAG: hypothetical protein KC420_23220, partial [Myxococcales bacterium]|nr:hypothetical protein [Myxococcales bacterium]
MKTATLALALALALPFALAACDASNSAEDSKKSEQAKDAAKPDGAAKADAGPAEGYHSYVLAALGEVQSQTAITKAETKAYGCSVKYA